MFIFHLIILSGKTAPEQENTENQSLFNLHMAEVKQFRKKHILKRASYVHLQKHYCII